MYCLSKLCQFFFFFFEVWQQTLLFIFLHLIYFFWGVGRAAVLTPAGECRINYRLFPSKKTHMDYHPLMILAAVPALLRLPVTGQILYSFSCKCICCNFGDLDTRSFVTDATSDENFRLHVLLP